MNWLTVKQLHTPELKCNGHESKELMKLNEVRAVEASTGTEAETVGDGKVQFFDNQHNLILIRRCRSCEKQVSLL